jgi:small-conductance mechanosensitive channel
MLVHPENILNDEYMLYYLLIILGMQLLLASLRKSLEARREAKRRRAGLTDSVIASTGSRLGELKRQASLEALIVLVTVLVTPFILFEISDEGLEKRQGLALAFIALFVYVLFTGSTVGKAFIGGMAFRMMAAFNPPFQVGDRVTLSGQSGRVTELGIFHVRLITPGQDLVSIPTAKLWGETLISTNAGDQASLCELPFYLATGVSRRQRKAAEEQLTEIIQRSTYFDFSRPVQILVEQTGKAIRITAKAFVANTYNEFPFKSEVTDRFLDWACDNGIPLATKS